MSRVVMVLSAVLLLGLPALAQETMTARGKVTSVSAGSIVVDVAGKSMTFSIDKDTRVTKPGAGTKTREAEKAGMGVTVTDLVAVGDGVEIRYHEMGGKMHASEIRAGISVGTGGMSMPGGKTDSATGTVAAVSASSITIKSDSQEWTFAIDKATRVVGEGVGTADRAKEAEGKGLVITDVVGMNDRVRVTYSTDKKQATEIRVVSKAPKS
jgi:hypothetical protein